MKKMQIQKLDTLEESMDIKKENWMKLMWKKENQKEKKNKRDGYSYYYP